MHSPGLSVVDRLRACIYLGYHRRHVATSQCQESLEIITGLIAAEVEKTPTAKDSAIALAASKEFLDTFLVHIGPGPEKMLRGAELDEVIDKFRMLSSPNVQNIIATFRATAKKKGEIERIFEMKKVAKMEYIHDSIFSGQGQDKVNLFKMLVDGPGSGVDFVQRMQPGGDFQNYFVMFNHMKRVRPWITLACHVYDFTYCKMMTIAECDMQSKSIDGQVIF